MFVLLYDHKEKKRKLLKEKTRRESMVKLRLYLKNGIKESNLKEDEIIDMYNHVFRKGKIGDYTIRGLFARSQAAINEARNLLVGTEVFLEPEPDNLHDCFAVKIMSNGYHLGYIPQEVSYCITDEIKQGGHIAIVTKVESYYSHTYLKEEVTVGFRLYPLFMVDTINISE